MVFQEWDVYLIKKGQDFFGSEGQDLCGVGLIFEDRCPVSDWMVYVEDVLTRVVLPN